MNRRNTTKVSSTKRLFSRRTFYAHTMPGLEKVAWRELEEKLPGVKRLGNRAMGTKNGLLLFEYDDNPSLLGTLHTVEDVFYVVGSLGQLPAGREGLDLLPAMMMDQVDWERLLSIYQQGAGSSFRLSRRTTYRVISRVLGDHPFYRKEAQSRIEKVIREIHPRWLLVEDEGELEFWLNIFGDEVIVGLRLSDRTMRHRAYKRKHLPASLRPTVAASMVLLSDPHADDVFLDPMCGAGTILIERALWGDRYQQLLGGDIRAEAVSVALANIGTKYKPIEVQQWDATRLTSLADGSIDRVVCNLPFGRQVGSQAENKALYRRFLQEMARVHKPGGRMVLLIGDVRLLRQELRTQEASWKVLETIPFHLLGVRAEIFVLVRRD